MNMSKMSESISCKRDEKTLDFAHSKRGDLKRKRLSEKDVEIRFDASSAPPPAKRARRLEAKDTPPPLSLSPPLIATEPNVKSELAAEIIASPDNQALDYGEPGQCRACVQFSLIDKPKNCLAGKCQHTQYIHPAYSYSYQYSHCPYCVTTAALARLRMSEDMIMLHGGVRSWKDQVHEQQCSSLDYKTWVTGKRAILKGIVGCLNYRHMKVVLANLVRELEALSRMEKAWEERQEPGVTTSTQDEVHYRIKYGATGALETILLEQNIGRIGRVDKCSAVTARKFGRDSELAIHLHFPGDHDSFFTQEQAAFIENQQPLKDMVTFQDLDDTPREKSTKSRPGVKVGFCREVFVQSEADIDILYDYHCSKGIDIHGNTPDQLSDSLSISGSLRFDITPLRHRNGKSKYSYRFKRYHPFARSKWPKKRGYEAVDTSGSSMSPDEWLRYVRELEWGP